MRYLIDTQILIWVMHNDRERLSGKILDLLEKEKENCSISIASLWEMTIKKSLEKLKIDDAFLRIVQGLDVPVMPVTIDHLQVLQVLPYHHKDPFDRLLVAQAICEGLALITSDKHLERYDAKIILA